MENIDISGLENKYSKTMIYFMINSLEAYNWEDDIEIKAFIELIENSGGNINYVMNQIESDIEQFRNLKTLTDNDKIYYIKDNIFYLNFEKTYFPVDTYCNCGVMAMDFISIKESFSNIRSISNCIGTDNIIKCFNHLSEITSKIIFLNQSISSLAITKAQTLDEFSFSKKYMPSPLLIGDVHGIKDFWRIFCLDYIDIESDEMKRMLALKIRSDVDFLKKKIRFLEFQHAIISILGSPFYEYEYKDILYTIYSKIQELMHNCLVIDMYIDFLPVNSRIPISTRGAKERTTRIQIIFSLPNQSYFNLRLDLPHKGMEYIHINIHDENGENALPIEQKDWDLLNKCIDINVLKSIFYENDNKYWFCTMFEKKIVESMEISDEQKGILIKIFKENSHFKLETKNLKDVDYFEELRFFITINKDFKTLESGKLEYRKNLKMAKFRDLYYILTTIIMFREKEDVDRIKEIVIDRFYNSCEYDEFKKQEVEVLDLIDVLELIELKIIDL